MLRNGSNYFEELSSLHISKPRPPMCMLLWAHLLLTSEYEVNFIRLFKKKTYFIYETSDKLNETDTIPICLLKNLLPFNG